MPNTENDLQTEYRFDYQKSKPNRFAVRNNVKKLKVVVLDDDVAQVFTTPESVNEALRAFMRKFRSYSRRLIQRSDGLDGGKRRSQICDPSARQRSKPMKIQYPLFSQVALAEDLPEHHLKRGDIATVVEYYPMSNEEDDGYSLEGFGVSNITIEVAASQIISVSQWQQEEEFLGKVRQLSQFSRPLKHKRRRGFPLHLLSPYLTHYR